jgi:hypothetical protein
VRCGQVIHQACRDQRLLMSRSNHESLAHVD